MEDTKNDKSSGHVLGLELRIPDDTPFETVLSGFLDAMKEANIWTDDQIKSGVILVADTLQLQGVLAKGTAKA